MTYLSPLTNLRRIRQERALSQRQLGRQLNWPQGYIHLLERGLPPREADHVVRLAEALRVRPDLLSGEPLLKLDDAITAPCDAGVRS